MSTDDEREAREIAAILMRHALDGGPLTAVRRLTRLLRILSIVTRVITHERNRAAYSLTCYGSHRRVAEHVGVSSSTMQRWMEAGSPNGSMPSDGDENNELGDVE